MKKKLSVIICLILIMSLMTGCTTFNNFKNAFFSDGGVISNVEENEKTIKIGVYQPLTGDNKEKGNEEKIGIQLAHELYPEVLGRKVELVYADNQGDMYVAETVIKELIAQNPAVILGSYGETVTLVAGDYIKEAEIPSITLTGTNPLLTVNNEYYFSATFTETKQGIALADFLCKDNGVKKVATVRVSGDDTVTSTVQKFNNRVKAITGEKSSVVGNYQLSMETTDFTETLNKIKASGAEAVFLAVSPAKAEAFLKQAESAGLTEIIYVGTKAWNDEDFLKYINDAKVFDIAYTSDFAVEANMTKMSETFINAYKAKYGTNSEPTEAMAIAFDGYLLAIKAIENAYNDIIDTDFTALAEDESVTEEEIKEIRAEWLNAQETGLPSGKLIKEALSNIEGFEGASGTISFAGTNEANKTIVVNHNVKGEVQVPFTEEDEEVSSDVDETSEDGLE